MQLLNESLRYDITGFFAYCILTLCVLRTVYPLLLMKTSSCSYKVITVTFLIYTFIHIIFM